MNFLNPVDVHVGARVRASRIFRNYELCDLASAVKIPTSCLIEYEVGKARCPPEQLAAIAETLNVRGSFFFAGLPNKATKTAFPVSNKRPESELANNDNFACTERASLNSVNERHTDSPFATKINSIATSSHQPK